MTTLGVTVIVVNWNLREKTHRCLLSLAQIDQPCRIIVVDNGSNDGSVEQIASHFPQSDLITLSTNVGFAAACNRGIDRALEDRSCEFVFILNNDAVVHPQALNELTRAALKHTEAGILGPKTYFRDEPNRIWHAGARRRWGVLAAADTGCGQVDRGQFDMLREVDYVFGTAMLIRRSVFERVGLFDERFFLYLEDLDLCLRAQAGGFSLVFVPKAHVWHEGSASTAHNRGMRKYHLVRSSVFFLRKHATPISSLPVLVFWSLVSGRAMLAEIVHGDLAALRFYWRGFVDGLLEARSL
jgi:GT2 family glycosyltransferase